MTGGLVENEFPFTYPVLVIDPVGDLWKVSGAYGTEECSASVYVGFLKPPRKPLTILTYIVSA